MTRLCPTRRGLALIETVATALVLAVLLALLVPAMRLSQAESLTAGCADHLRQIGQAAHAYEDAYNGLPPRRLRRPVHHGLAAVLTPYLGDEAIAKEYRLDLDFYAPENAAAIARPLAVFQSPSAPKDRKPVDVTDAGMIPSGRPGAPSDYFTVHSVHDLGIVEKVRGIEHAALADDARTPRASILDGAAYTLLITEQAGRPDHWVLGKNRGPESLNLNGWWGAW
ncbi:MAG TPA: DUF1559 domain-containing protein, partial [Pirellulales bacterium]